MKALATIIASLSAAAISLGATFEADAALSGNMRSDEHNNYVVKNTGKESGQLVLDFDLSGCPLGNAPQFAAIYMQAFSPDEKLAHDVGKIKQAYDEYKKLAYLQLCFMDKHGEIAPNVFVSRYSDGSEIVSNYSDKPFAYKSQTVRPLGYMLFKK